MGKIALDLMCASKFYACAPKILSQGSTAASNKNYLESCCIDYASMM